MVAASYRDIARRLGISKDTVGRRLALLRRDGVMVELSEESADRFETRSYRLYLDFAGVSREPSQDGAVSPRAASSRAFCCCRPTAGRCVGRCARWSG